MKARPHAFYLSHASQVRRHTIRRANGSALILEADGEVVALTAQDRRPADALYLGHADMQELVDTWNAWYGVGGSTYRPFRPGRRPPS